MAEVTVDVAAVLQAEIDSFDEVGSVTYPASDLRLLLNMARNALLVQGRNIEELERWAYATWPSRARATLGRWLPRSRSTS